MPDAAYYRAWRAAHPGYRERQKAVRRELRKVHGRGDRSSEYARRKSRATPPMPVLHLGHALLEQAVRIAGVRDGFRFLEHPFRDDLVGAITLALVEGRCPQEAKQEFLRTEYAWRHVTVQLLDGAEVHEGRLLVHADRL